VTTTLKIHEEGFAGQMEFGEEDALHILTKTMDGAMAMEITDMEIMDMETTEM